jgi:hypothetical protein
MQEALEQTRIADKYEGILLSLPFIFVLQAANDLVLTLQTMPFGMGSF